MKQKNASFSDAIGAVSGVNGSRGRPELKDETVGTH